MDQDLRGEWLKSPEKEQAKLNILVVDDQQNISTLMERFIGISTVASQVGLIEKALDGQEAFDVLKKNKGKFNVVLTDGQMPRMGGLELAKKIKASEEDIVVGLMSGNMNELGLSDPKTQASVMRDYGIAAVLPKPFNRQQISEFMGKIKDIREAKNAVVVQSQTP